MFKKSKIDYRHYICIFITLLFLSCAYFFQYSFLRFYESIKDFGLSVGYYFCEILFIPHHINVSVTDISNTSNEIIKNFKLFDFSNFGTYFELGFFRCWNIETLQMYFYDLVSFLNGFIRIVLFSLPLLLLLILKYRSYYRENNNAPNKDSKYLVFYKTLKLNILQPIIKWFSSLFDFIKTHKAYRIIWCCIWAFYFNFFAIIIEFVAFYFYFVISFDLKSILFQIYKLFVDLLPMIKFIPLVFWIGLLLYIVHKIRFKIGYQRLIRYENRNKGYINSTGQVSMICAPMGKGKTTTLTDMALSQEVMFRDKAFEKILENDLKFPNFPFINLENELKRAISYHQVYNLATCRVWIRKKEHRFNDDKCKCFDYDFKKYGLTYYDGLKEITLWDMLESYVQLYFIYIIESSLLVANYGIREDNILQDLGNFPLWHSDFFQTDKEYINSYSRHSHILDFDMLRLGKKVVEDNYKSNAFEFGVIVITEGGKERGNMLDTKEMKKNSDEANQKNDLFNMWLKLCRHSATIDNFPFIKVFIDEQRPESMGADVRELCEKIIFVREKEETKNTLLFFRLNTIVYDFMFDKFNSIYYKYRFYRSDNTLLVYLIKNIFAKYHHYYVKLQNTFSFNRLILESEKGTLDNDFQKDKYYIMHKKIYSKRFATDAFSDYFKQKSLYCSIGINDLQEFQTEKATLEELQSENSYFINDLTKKGGN